MINHYTCIRLPQMTNFSIEHFPLSGSRGWAGYITNKEALVLRSHLELKLSTMMPSRCYIQYMIEIKPRDFWGKVQIPSMSKVLLIQSGNSTEPNVGNLVENIWIKLKKFLTKAG